MIGDNAQNKDNLDVDGGSKDDAPANEEKVGGVQFLFGDDTPDKDTDEDNEDALPGYLGDVPVGFTNPGMEVVAMTKGARAMEEVLAEFVDMCLSEAGGQDPASLIEEIEKTIRYWRTRMLTKELQAKLRAATTPSSKLQWQLKLGQLCENIKEAADEANHKVNVKYSANLFLTHDQ